ncbi:hypothetical protein QRX60_31855 [Amycolatopsis mongoliensis]|uniref:Uncharacterized protein n=1 Tax=Amycolatopsis mongoliensis TaxID=715475 RepID=A0A9Y2JHC2_9PSEU|nr:hypothetical protein [Amycolatopsis sp. 4-36]WIX98645.1 hypothetical protein QRX60_31855 [Amycolatopsis sp. 4-36]
MIDKIRHTGQAAGRVAEGLRDGGCAAAVPAGDLGMPGSRAALKMAEVKHVLVYRQRGFESRLDTHAGNMAKAADHYAPQESAAPRRTRWTA